MDAHADVVAPVAGVLSDRIGSRPLMSARSVPPGRGRRVDRAGQEPTVAYGLLVPAFVMGGTGMALVFAPAANAVLGAVKPEEAGQASGANNAIRELGGVLGVAVLAAVFTGAGGFESPQASTTASCPPCGSAPRARRRRRDRPVRAGQGARSRPWSARRRRRRSQR